MMRAVIFTLSAVVALVLTFINPLIVVGMIALVLLAARKAPECDCTDDALTYVERISPTRVVL